MKVISIKDENLDTNKTIYTCNTCGSYFNWMKGQSTWFGSYTMSENNPEKIKYFCREKCQRIITNK